MQQVKLYFEKNRIKYKENVSFKALTTYKTGGIAKFVVYPSNVKKLIKLLQYLKKTKIDFKIFGNGSNILASDKNYNGVIVKLTELQEETFKKGILTVEAGSSTMKVANKYSKKGYSGLEFACGIPGTIGGAVYMNAGAYLENIGDSIVDVKYLDENLEIQTIAKKDMELDYRDSIFKRKNWIILSARILLKPVEKDELNDLIKDRYQRRIASQPLEYSSAGSVFRNPKDQFAGKLIEDCGLKGKSKGDAQISVKHANFIINKGEATSKDIKCLMDLATKKVKEKHNVELIREQELFNWE